MWCTGLVVLSQALLFGGGCAGSLLLHRFALVAVSGAQSLVVVPGLLIAVASLIVVHGLSNCGTRA